MDLNHRHTRPNSVGLPAGGNRGIGAPRCSGPVALALVPRPLRPAGTAATNRSVGAGATVLTQPAPYPGELLTVRRQRFSPLHPG